MVSPARLCLICKGGRQLCGHSPCPLLPKFDIEKKLLGRISRDFFGPSYSVFVGRYGFPRVNVGPMVAVEEKAGLDSPNQWLNKDYSDIVELRSLLLRSKQRENIKSRSRLVMDSQELVLASKPTDVEMNFKKDPVYHVSFSDVVQPMGPSALLDRMKVTENVHVPRRVDKIVSDELKANQQSYELYRAGQDVYKISAILSSGALGLEKNKKMVPTRWSVTASQTIIANKLIEKIKQYPSINEYVVYSSEKLDNHFEVLLMPGNWEYENFEAWSPGSMWTAQMKKPVIIEEYEPFEGRKKYAELQGGGFYSSRLGVAEGLDKLKRQARVVVFREVYEGYTVPVGCWQIVENVRNAFQSGSLKFDTKQEALKHIGMRLKLPLRDYIKQSKLLKQKRFHDFLKHN